MVLRGKSGWINVMEIRGLSVASGGTIWTTNKLGTISSWDVVDVIIQVV